MFPLEKEDYWNEKGYTNLITDVGGTIRDTKINSVQNGLLIRSVHYPFQGFVTNILLYRAILRIIVFGPDSARLDRCAAMKIDPRRVSMPFSV